MVKKKQHRLVEEMDSLDVGWSMQPLSSWMGDIGIDNKTSFNELADDQQPSNQAAGTEMQQQSYSLTETVLISAALLIIIIGTIVGNILVCVAVCLVRRL